MIQIYYSNELYHHGIKGQKWGVRNGPPYPLDKNGVVFISGSWRTSENGSPYSRKVLSNKVTSKIDEYITDKKQIIVGEAPGIDRQVQDYLNSRNYRNVVVYHAGSQPRYLSNRNWNTVSILSNLEEGSKEWLASKDIAMSDAATEGLAIILDNNGAQATRNNIIRLYNSGKPVMAFQLSCISEDLDDYINIEDVVK